MRTQRGTMPYQGEDPQTEQDCSDGIADRLPRQRHAFATGDSPAPVAIDPTGNFVFVGNTGGDSLSAYTISAADALTPVAGTPVPLGSISQPGSIAVDPSGKFVYVSIVPREVAAFALTPGTGALTPITGSPFVVGQVTRDVVVVKP